jgi:hypothetical protein
MGPVTDVADLTEFMGAAVERYDGDGFNDAPGSPVVRYWEIYNEPDGTDEWHARLGGYGFFGEQGDVYANHLSALYPVVKAASLKAQVVFGGVAGEGTAGSGIDPNFTDDVLANCVGRCFDVMNFHYYPLFRSNWEVFGRDLIGKAQYFRSKLAGYGLERPIMCTETTWGAAGSWGSPDLQSRYVLAAYVRAMAADLLMTSWYAWKDIDSGLPGLLDDKLNPKSAYFVFQTLTRQLNGASFERPLELAETGDPDIEGYVFSISGASGQDRRDVVWLDCPSLRESFPQDCPGEMRTMSVSASMVLITDKFGTSHFRSDADDGMIDGSVFLTITPDPIYIDYTP